MITAKVTCNLKQEYGTGDGRYATVGFSPDYADGANASWAKATPHLDLRMTVHGPVADSFEAGKKYTLQFVEEGEPDDAA